MSITKFQAYKIADKLMSLKVGPESEAKIKELLADTDRRLEAYVPQEVKDFAEKFPKYVHHSNYHNVSNGSGFRVGLYSGQSLISLPGTDTGYSRVSDEDFNAFDANTKAIEEIRGNLRKVREEIVNKIKGKGVESVCKTWPEACSIVRELMGDKAQLPAIMNSELNTMLGLPVEN